MLLSKFKFIPIIWFSPEPSQARVIGIRQNPNTNSAQNMARSLPVSVPLPEGLPKRGEIFDLPSDEEGDEDSDIDTEGKYFYLFYLLLSIFNS